MEAILYLIFLLVILVVTAIFTRWLFRIDDILISLKDNSKQNSVLIQQNDEIIRLLDE